jgi:MFS family permease
MLCVFLAALDSTITAVAAPAICRELGCSSADFQWLASSYLLGSAAFMPMYGRLSDIVGRKPVMYSGILLFLLGSGLCGGAKNIRWMIGCRAIQGVGGGAIMSLTQVIISDIVTLQDRGRYASFLGSVWGYVDGETSCNKPHRRDGRAKLHRCHCRIASVLGPLFGGFIVNGGRSFAWCFWLNL